MESVCEESIKTWQAYLLFRSTNISHILSFWPNTKNLNKIENSTTKYTTNHVAIMTNIEREKERERERERRLWKKKLIRVQ
jgi:hypothetical protein